MKVSRQIVKQNVEKLLISNKAIEKLKENEIMNFQANGWTRIILSDVTEDPKDKHHMSLHHM